MNCSKITILLLLILLFLNYTSALGQEKKLSKVGLVNSKAVMAAMPEWKAGKVNITTYADSLNAVLAEKVATLNTAYAKLKKQMPILKGNAGRSYLAEKKEELAAQKALVDRLKAEIPEQIEGQVTILTESLQSKIEDAIFAVSQELEYDFVYDSLKAGDCFYVSSPAYDLTDYVIAEVNKTVDD